MASKQWVFVGTVVAGLAIGAFALVKFGPQIAGVEVGAHAPDFRAVDLKHGDTVSLYQKYRGNVTLVNIWATYCIPCRTEMPAMEAVYQRLGPKGFRIAAVSIDDGSPDDVRAFGREYKLTFDLLQDAKGDIKQSYLITGIPESFLLDKDGVIVRKVIQAHPWNSPENQRIIEQLLAN